MTKALKVYSSVVSNWPCNRHDIQDDTMLDSAQVANAMDHLVRRDLIKPVEVERSDRTGRPCKLYTPFYAPVGALQ